MSGPESWDSGVKKTYAKRPVAATARTASFLRFRAVRNPRTTMIIIAKDIQSVLEKARTIEEKHSMKKTAPRGPGMSFIPAWRHAASMETARTVTKKPLPETALIASTFSNMTPASKAK